MVHGVESPWTKKKVTKFFGMEKILSPEGSYEVVLLIIYFILQTRRKNVAEMYPWLLLFTQSGKIFYHKGSGQNYCTQPDLPDHKIDGGLCLHSPSQRQKMVSLLHSHPSIQQ